MPLKRDQDFRKGFLFSSALFIWTSLFWIQQGFARTYQTVTLTVFELGFGRILWIYLLYRFDTGLSAFFFIWKLYIKDHFSYLDETFFNFPRMRFEQNRINRSVFLLRSIQIQDIHFEINPKMNMPPFKYYPMSAKKSIRLNVKTVNVNFIIRFRRFF